MQSPKDQLENQKQAAPSTLWPMVSTTAVVALAYLMLWLSFEALGGEMSGQEARVALVFAAFTLPSLIGLFLAVVAARWGLMWLATVWLLGTMLRLGCGVATFVLADIYWAMSAQSLILLGAFAYLPVLAAETAWIAKLAWPMSLPDNSATLGGSSA